MGQCLCKSLQLGFKSQYIQIELLPFLPHGPFLAFLLFSPNLPPPHLPLPLPPLLLPIPFPANTRDAAGRSPSRFSLGKVSRMSCMSTACLAVVVTSKVRFGWWSTQVRLMASSHTTIADFATRRPARHAPSGKRLAADDICHKERSRSLQLCQGLVEELVPSRPRTLKAEKTLYASTAKWPKDR